LNGPFTDNYDIVASYYSTAAMKLDRKAQRVPASAPPPKKNKIITNKTTASEREKSPKLKAC